MATEKRARQRANRQAKIEEQVKEDQRAKQRSWLIRGGIIAATLIAILVAINVFSGDDETTEAAADGTSSESADGDEATDAEPATDGACTPRDDQVLSFADAPDFELADGATYEALLDTNQGQITVALDAERAPNTVNNFVFLARNGYYDCVTFHRVIEGFMIQGGDPVGDPPGTGGPGYTFDDELPEAGEYQLGSVAMANAGPNTNGSQFFIVTGAQGEALPPQYSLFGTVTEGLDVATAIQSVSTDVNDKPLDDVVVNSVTITES